MIQTFKKSAKIEEKVRAPQNLQTPDIEINPDFSRALDLLENTDKNVFITGKAGTGKSTLLQYFRKTTAKNIVVLAPTGVAALNVKGQTIHSFFRFSPNITTQTISKQPQSQKLKNLLQKIDAIIIDEVSMVRADLMDCIDTALRWYRNSKEPFGGLQMIFIGDLYQLPPVVASRDEKELFRTYYPSPYFFDAKIFENMEMEFIELHKIYRQKDPAFIDLLNKIRNSSVEEPDIAKLNTRLNLDFDSDYSSRDFYITLTTTNASADAINDQKLSRLKAERKTYHGTMAGEFEKGHLPTSMELAVKVGAQIMLVNNDSRKRWVNGSIGKIMAIEYDEESGEDRVIVKLNDGKTVDVAPYTWEIFRYFFNKKAQRLDVEMIGSFCQYPLRLAWAVTIHKSQGKTFDHVVIDLGKGSFVQGQVYVAISRCTSFYGLVLKKPIQKKHIWVDYRIMRFLTRRQYEINDTKSRRTIEPRSIGDMEYLGKTFLGMEAYCLKRKDMRNFRIDRILEIK